MTLNQLRQISAFQPALEPLLQKAMAALNWYWNDWFWKVSALQIHWFIFNQQRRVWRTTDTQTLHADVKQMPLGIFPINYILNFFK
jgi:hypothetical protein